MKTVYYLTAIAITSSLLVVSDAVAQTPTKYGYVVDATNRIMDILSTSVEPDQKALAEATSVACMTLKRLLADQQFRADLMKISNRSASRAADRAILKHQLAMFAGEFLLPEAEALKKAGLSAIAVQELLWSATFFRDAVDNKPNGELILVAAGKLQQEICDAAKVLQQAHATPQATPQATVQGKAQTQAESRKTFTKWAYRFGGFVLIVIDVTGSIPSATVSDVSVPVGAAVMSWND
jgi:hypothetical protein